MSNDDSDLHRQDSAVTEPVFESDLTDLFEPESVALIGASTDSETINGRVQYFLEEYEYPGDVYPVNPGYDEIRGLTCYESVTDIPGEVDLAMSLVPADITPSILEECGQKGIEFVVVIASGFSEVGKSGEQLESELRDIASKHGIRVLGPNSEGIINLARRVTLSFSSILKRGDLRIDGDVGFVTQSGSFGGAIFQLAQSIGIGSKYWFSVGNEIDIDAVELMNYMLEDPDIDMVVGYIESFKRGEAFQAVARKARANNTPLVFLKVGSSDRGQEAVASHTGKMAGDDAVYRSVFAEHGVITPHGMTEFKDILSMLHTVDRERYLPVNDGLGVVTVSGGAGALIADTCLAEGINLATLSTETTEELAEILPPYGSTTNPVDVTGKVITDSAFFKRSLSIVLEDPSVNALLVQFGNSGGPMAAEYLDTIQDLQERTGKLIIPVFTGGHPPESVLRSYRDAGIQPFKHPVRAVRTLASVSSFDPGTGLTVDEPQLDRQSRTESPARLTEASTWEEFQSVGETFGIPAARGGIAATADEAVEIADAIGYPVVTKASAEGLDHKTEIGGVRTNVHSPEVVRESFEQIAAAVKENSTGLEQHGVLVQEQTEPTAIEMVVGITDSTDFGPVLMVGTGGVFVESLDDIAYRPLPVTRESFDEMLQPTTLGDVLSGYRGASYPVDQVWELVRGTQALYTEQGSIRELELNPVAVTEDSVLVVDFLVSEE